MLCPDCRCQVTRGAAFCGSCGMPLGAGDPPLELVLASGERVPLIGDVVIGRAPASTLRLDDPSVSRTHARISAGNGTVRIEDAGSSHGTFLDGVRVERAVALRDGAQIRVGDQELGVERRRELAEAGRTLVVRPGSTLLVSAAGVVPQPSHVSGVIVVVIDPPGFVRVRGAAFSTSSTTRAGTCRSAAGTPGPSTRRTGQTHPARVSS